jgi:hypothetical protein
MLGSYYPPYFPTPGQPRIAPGAGSIGAYYPTGGLGTDSGPGIPSLGVFLVGMAINAGAGYLVGKQLGYPTAGAIATGVFGLPGLFVTALYASSQRRKVGA